MQDWLDNVRGRANDLLGDVSGEVDRQRRLRVLEKQHKEAERRRTALLVELGESVSVLMSKGLIEHPSLRETYDHLNRIDEELGQISTMMQEQAQQAQTPHGERNCASCGSAVPSDSTFCPNCGLQIKISSAELFCDQCGAAQVPGASFCAECGARLVMATPQPSQVQASPAEKHEETVHLAEQLPAAVMTDAQCLHCGNSLEANALFCGECGWVVERQEDAVTAVGQAPDAFPAETESTIDEASDKETIIAEPAYSVLQVEDLTDMAIAPAVETPLSAASTSQIEAIAQEDAENSPVDQAVEPAGDPVEEDPDDSAEPTAIPPDLTSDEAPFAATTLLPNRDIPSDATDTGETATGAAPICPTCGTEFRAGAPFCPGCGAPQQPQEAPDSGEVVRIHCDVVLDPEMSFCPICGEEVPFAAAGQEPECIHCGTRLRTDARFCPECGQAVS